MTSPFIPCSFTYGDAPQGGQVMPMIIAGRDPSNVTDKNYASGYLWLSDLSQGGSGNLFVQEGFVAGTPTWTSVTAGSLGALNTLSDGVTQVAPIGGNIGLASTPNQVTVTSSAPSHELIFSLPAILIAPGSIASTSTMTVGTTLTVTGDAAFGDDVTIADDLTVTGDLIVSGAIVLAGLTVAGTVELNVTGNANTSIGNPIGSGAILIDTPSGDFTLNGNGNEIHIGDDANANIIFIGNDTGATEVTITAGTGDLLLTGAVTTAITIGDSLQTGLITLGLSTAGQDIDIGSGVNASAQVIDIANGASAANSTVRILSGTGTAGAGQILLGNNTRVTVASLADVAPAASRTTTVGGGTITTAVTDTIDIGPDGATTNAGATKTVNVNTGGVTLGSVLTNIATGAVTSGTHTTAIATGNRAAGTMAVNLLTGTGTKTLNIGNADGLTTTNILGPHNINVSQNNNTAINSGTSTGTVTIGNSLASAITIDTAAGISLDAATASNFTVTGAGADLTLSSVGGSVLVSSTENAALAIRLHANGGTSETIQVHADQGIGAASIGLLSDDGGITINGGLGTADAINLEANTAGGGIDIDSSTGGFDVLTTGAISLDASLASNLTVTGAAVDLTLASSGGSVNITATEAVADAIVINASNAAGGIDILSGGGQLDIGSNAVAQTANFNIGAANKTTVMGSLTTLSTTTIQSGTGGIALTSGVTTAGLISVAPSTDTQASPTAASTINSRVGSIIFTGFTTAAAASQTWTVTNSLVTTSSAIFVSVSNLGANDAQMTVQRVFPAAGSFTVVTKNNGAAALNGNVIVNFWVIN
jgi:hypothetical protein